MARSIKSQMLLHRINFITYVLFIVVAFAAQYTAKQTTEKQEKGLLDPSSKNEEEVVENIQKFDLRGTLRKRFGPIVLMHNTSKSSVCSPVSALLPLGKLALGARDSALKQLYSAIGLSVENEDNDESDGDHSDYVAVQKHLSALIEELRNVSKPTLDVASRLYVSNDKTLYKRFEKQARGIFRTAIIRGNFSESNALAEKINTWVSSQTGGKISEIVTQHDVSPASSLVIVNAVYFSGKWVEPFPQPMENPFYTSKGERQVLMMKNAKWYYYAFSDQLYAKLVDIPYSEKNMSLLLVVPEEKSGLKTLLQRLKSHPEYLAEAIEEMKEEYVVLTMPTFTIESEWDLKHLYQEIGIKSIFRKERSGLSGIVRRGEPYVTRAIQKAIIEVSHVGEDNRYMSLVSSWTRGVNVTANHPFVFYVRCHSQQLLMGTFY